MFSLEVMHVRGYDDFVQTDELDSNRKDRILLSRNKPVGLVIGAAGFIGSHVCDYLLKRDIQVIAVDDFSSGKKENLDQSTKEKNFHLINADISSAQISESLTNLSRLDYVIFTPSNQLSNSCYEKGIDTLFELVDSLVDEKNSEKKIK